MLIDPTILSNTSVCVAVKAGQDLDAISGGRTPKNWSVSAVFKMVLLRGYVENGTVLEEGFVAYATLDLSSFVAFGSLIGNVVIDGVVVGVLPDDTYADLDEVIDGFVSAINLNSIGYQATNNGDGTITVAAPNAGSQANGFEITIQINPTFDRLTQLNFDNKDWRQPIHINTNTSALYGHTLVAAISIGGTGTQFVIQDIYNQANVQAAPVSLGTGAFALTHRPTDDTVFTSAFQDAVNNIEQLNSSLQSLGFITMPGTPGAGWAVWNAFNSCLYFANTSSNKVTKIDPTGVQTNITGITGVTELIVIPATGVVWALGTASLWRIDPTTNIATAITTVGEVPTSLTYSSSSDTVFVSLSTPGVIREYNLDGTVATATFYSLAGVVSVIYSEVYNVLFAGTAAIIHVIKMDGTLKNTIADGCYDFVEDIGRGQIIGIIDAGPGGIGKVNFYGLAADGTDVFDGALEDGVDPVLQEEDNQCLTVEQIGNVYQEMNRECLSCTTLTDTTAIPVVGGSTIYYGNSATGSLDAAGIAALGSRVAATFAGIYTFASSGGTYKYIAYPTNLGLALSFIDTNTGLPVAMSTMYTVIINYITYNVYRTYNLMGGALSITVSS
jgi:hypothetical protein